MKSPIVDRSPSWEKAIQDHNRESEEAIRAMDAAIERADSVVKELDEKREERIEAQRDQRPHWREA